MGDWGDIPGTLRKADGGLGWLTPCRLMVITRNWNSRFTVNSDRLTFTDDWCELFSLITRESHMSAEM